MQSAPKEWSVKMMVGKFALISICALAFAMLFLPTYTYVVGEHSSILSAAASVLSRKEKEMRTILPTSGQYVYVDMQDRMVELHEGAKVLGNYPILSYPGNGAPTHVVSGVYMVEAKQRSELSTITEVRFPYVVHFGDRYSFHGTPVNAQTEVGMGEYAGGSIELATTDMEHVYRFLEKGMPVYVDAQTDEEDLDVITAHFIPEDAALPATTAHAFALADVERGTIYIVQNGTEKYPIASITKLMTAAVASDVIGPGSEVVGPDDELYTLGDLYYPLLLRSDNAVAECIASHSGREFFMGHLNAYVHALGMADTVFADPSGLSPKNISTANDLLVFAQHLYMNKRFLYEISREGEALVTSAQGEEWSMTNQNKLASDPHFFGGKLGFTDEAGQTALSIFTIPIGDEVRPVAVVVLRSKDWKQDTRTLLRWLTEVAKE